MLRKLGLSYLLRQEIQRFHITCEFPYSSPLQLAQTPLTEKKPKPKPRKNHYTVDIPPETEKQSFAGFEGMAPG